MSDEDWWERWYRKMRWPSFRSGFTDIDDIFREMEEMMQKEFSELSRKAPEDLVREQKLPDGTKVKRWGPFVYGYSVTLDPDGRPKMKEFGNIKPGAKYGRPSIEIKEKREPLTDVISTNVQIEVLVELPGVEKKDIKLHGTEQSVTISVDTPQRKYFKEVHLPAKVSPRKAKSIYKNGVLIVKLPKKQKEKTEGELINVE